MLFYSVFTLIERIERMKIKIDYKFYTDGDYTLKNPEQFGCTTTKVSIGDDYYDYVGAVEFSSQEDSKCKREAKGFLEKLLCDGIHVLYTHYWLLGEFCEAIESLIDGIDDYRSDGKNALSKELTGNQDGTSITVTIKEDENVSID